MGGNYKTVTTYQPKSINDSFDDERNALERATQIIINENSIRDYDVWNGRSGEHIFKADGVLDDSQGCCGMRPLSMPFVNTKGNEEFSLTKPLQVPVFCFCYCNGSPFPFYGLYLNLCCQCCCGFDKDYLNLTGKRC